MGAGDSGTNMLDSTFSSGQQEEAAYGLLEQQMARYIDKKIKGDKNDEKEEVELTAEDELYVVPEEMKIKAKKEQQIDNGAETWLTGIIEVQGQNPHITMPSYYDDGLNLDQ